MSWGGGGGGGGGGGQNFFFLKFKQIWCASYSHGEGQKRQISLNFSYKVNFKSNFVCLLTNERYQTYKTGFSFHRLGHAPGVGLGGAGGGKLNFLNMDMWHIKLKG